MSDRAPLLSRRAFLRAAGVSAGLLAAARLHCPPALLAAERGAATGLRLLDATDARILGAIAERITFTGDPAMPRFGDTAGLLTIDAALLQLPPDVPQQLSWALRLFEYGPPLWVGKLSTFTGFDPEWQDVYLSDWEQSRFQIRRVAFQAFKNLAFLGYYAQDATWAGIHYQGPWLPRPRVVITDDGWRAAAPSTGES